MMYLPVVITGLIILAVMGVCVFAAHIPVLREITDAAPLEENWHSDERADMDCNECGSKMGKIGGPGFKKMYTCVPCGTREVVEVNSSTANTDHVDDTFWSKVWGRKKNKDK